MSQATPLTCVRRDPAHAKAAVLHRSRSAVCPPKLHIERDVRAHDLPGVALLQPLVGDFHLPAVADLLVEDAELVADAVADRRHLERRERIQVAGGEPAEPAVAEARLFFQREQRVEVLAERLHGFARIGLDARG